MPDETPSELAERRDLILQLAPTAGPACGAVPPSRCAPFARAVVLREAKIDELNPADRRLWTELSSGRAQRRVEARSGSATTSDCRCRTKGHGNEYERADGHGFGAHGR